jgi:hypothetical protein
VLSVAVRGMEPLLLSIGSSHGTGKFEKIPIDACAAGEWTRDFDDSLYDPDVPASPAHLTCRVVRRDDAGVDVGGGFGKGAAPAKGSAAPAKGAAAANKAETNAGTSDKANPSAATEPPVAPEPTGHYALFARVTDAVVRSSHWDGRCFGSAEQPALTFLGSKRFAAMVPLAADAGSAGGAGAGVKRARAEDA